MTDEKNWVIDRLIAIGAVKFGEFRLKSGIISPIYLDLRLVISFPDLLKAIANLLQETTRDLSFQRIAGIPYTALPIATAYSLQSGKPMIYCRKEIKAYGTARQIEGIWNPGDSVLVVDDLITDGGSKFETFSVFEKERLSIAGVVVLIDREQGGRERLNNAGYQLFSIISIFEILERIKALNKISAADYDAIRLFLAQHRVNH